jgi:uncharacterized protein DUF6994
MPLLLVSYQRQGRAGTWGGGLDDLDRPGRRRPGHVDFFHLQDLMNERTSTLKLFTPFEDLIGSPLPSTLDAHLGYRLGVVSGRGLIW